MNTCVVTVLAPILSERHQYLLKNAVIYFYTLPSTAELIQSLLFESNLFLHFHLDERPPISNSLQLLKETNEHQHRMSTWTSASSYIHTRRNLLWPTNFYVIAKKHKFYVSQFTTFNFAIVKALIIIYEFYIYDVRFCVLYNDYKQRNLYPPVIQFNLIFRNRKRIPTNILNYGIT